MLKDEKISQSEPLPQEIDIKNMSQKEVIKMAKQITEQFEKPPTKIDLILGFIAYLIIYGGGLIFLLYVIIREFS